MGTLVNTIKMYMFATSIGKAIVLPKPLANAIGEFRAIASRHYWSLCYAEHL